MALSGGSSPALPPVMFIGARKLQLPVAVTNGTTETIPGPADPFLDFQGYNTLSVFATITALPGGNTLTAVLVTMDPETGAALASDLGDATLLTMAANDDYAATLYLPTYYATLSGLVLPFYQFSIDLVHTGAGVGDVSLDALKLWLTNA